MRYVLMTALFIVAMAADLRSSRADDRAPWCAVISLGHGSVVWDCQYRTFEECYPNVISGNRGFCNHNPRYEPLTAKPMAHAKRRVKRD
jgi:Protein of unknown function (DUF3551)